MEMTIGVAMLSSIARTMVLTMQKNKEEFFALGMIITTKILLMTIMAVLIYSNLDRTVSKEYNTSEHHIYCMINHKMFLIFNSPNMPGRRTGRMLR